LSVPKVAEATVLKKSGKIRRGRGFSRAELAEVGLDFQQALRLRLRVDQRRKTRRAENVKTLKRFVHKR